MEPVELIYSGRWSRGYRKGNEFIKQLVHYEPALAEREIKASQTACAAGLNVPRFLSSCDDGSEVRLHFEWKTMSKIYPHSLSSILPAVKNMTGVMQTIEWPRNDRYWEEILLKDFADALSYIAKEGDVHLRLLKSLTPSVFIHGDFSLQNMGEVGDSVYLYDFQHGCLGPQCWDLLYLASTLDPFVCSGLCQSEHERKIVCAIAAVKLGRALRRKKTDIIVKQLIYQQWKASISIP